MLQERMEPFKMPFNNKVVCFTLGLLVHTGLFTDDGAAF
jgi:hypothetical protein